MVEPLRASGEPARGEGERSRLQPGWKGSGQSLPVVLAPKSRGVGPSSAEEKLQGPEGVPGEPRRSDRVSPNGQDEPW